MSNISATKRLESFWNHKKQIYEQRYPGISEESLTRKVEKAWYIHSCIYTFDTFYCFLFIKS